MYTHTLSRLLDYFVGHSYSSLSVQRWKKRRTSAGNRRALAMFPRMNGHSFQHFETRQSARGFFDRSAIGCQSRLFAGGFLGIDPADRPLAPWGPRTRQKTGLLRAIFGSRGQFKSGDDAVAFSSRFQRTGFDCGGTYVLGKKGFNIRPRGWADVGDGVF